MAVLLNFFGRLYVFFATDKNEYQAMACAGYELRIDSGQCADFCIELLSACESVHGATGGSEGVGGKYTA